METGNRTDLRVKKTEAAIKGAFKEMILENEAFGNHSKGTFRTGADSP